MTLPGNMPMSLRKSWPIAAMVLALAITFGVYVNSEKQIDRANELRFLSFMLADQLRQSSDDLTQMARTYVVTGDPRYKKNYQDILDIRDGRKPRPEGYEYIYWDLALADAYLPQADSGQAIALLELMRQAGFTEAELSKLAEAKANSDGLTAIEFEAMRLVESAGPDAQANRARALLIMHDASYHRAKAAIMEPINEAYVLMDKRTADTVRAAKRNAIAFLIVFIACVLGAILMLWRAYAALLTTLGGPAEEVQAHILRIGRGDFSSAITVASGMESSILAGLSAMQIKLQSNETERVLAEEEKAQADARLRTLSAAIEQSPVTTVITDLAGNIVFVNPMFTETTGYTAEEAIGKNPRILKTENTPGSEYKVLWDTILSGQNWHGVFQNKRKNGELYWESAVISPVKDEEGAITHFLAVKEDITERKQMEEALKESREFASMIANNIPGMLGYWTRELRCTFANDEYLTSFGCTPEQMYSIQIQELLGDELFQKNEPFIRAALRGEDQRFERALIKANGETSYTWAQYTSHRVGDEVIGFFVLVTDITELKQAEEALKESEERHRILFMDSPDSYLILFDGVFVDCNRAAEVMLRGDRSQIIGQTPGMLSPEFQPDGRKSLEAAAEKITEILHTGSKTFEWVHRRLDGSDFFAEVSIASMMLNGKPALFTIWRDITERKQAEDALHESEERFRKLFERHSAVKLVIDPETGDIIDANEAAADFYGWPTEHLKQMSIQQINTLSPEAVKNEMEKARLSERTSFEFRHRRADGSIRDVEVFSNKINITGKDFLYSIVHDITERKLMEEKLRESEEKYRNIIDNSVVGVFRTTVKGEILYINDAIIKLLDFDSRDEFISQGSFMRYKDPRQRERMLNLISQNGKVEGFEANIVSSKGKEKIVLLSAVLHDDILDGTLIDITQRKQAEESLQESESRYRAVAQSANDAIVSSDSAGNIISWNRSAETIFGYSEAEAIGLPLTLLMPSHFHDAHNAGMTRVQSGGEKRVIGKTVEVDGQRKDGNIFPLEISLAEWQVDNDQFYTAILRDITERKRAGETLRESEEKIQAIFNVANTGISITDKNGKYVMFNHWWIDNLGYDNEEMKSLTNLDITHPDDKEISRAWFLKIINGEVDKYRLEKRFVRKDHSVFWGDLSVSAIKDKNNDIANVIGMVTDITGIKRLQEELRQLATTDELTGIANRRQLLELAHGEIKRALRLQHPLTIALMDIDLFKHINDTYGHAAGDQALRAFTEICQKNIREIDVFARFGGDEFALLLPETDCEQAYVVVERIRQAVAALTIDPDGRLVSITISSGIASLSSDRETFDTLLSRADQALYRAKETGRNKVVGYDDL